mmetsp:Transcript_39697/g.73705  ORF Transcript_39697/g.73705 Transcript_39697/m.73705 type:complete len:904 (+) Transcript_39697:21-2732(+)
MAAVGAAGTTATPNPTHGLVTPSPNRDGRKMSSGRQGHLPQRSVSPAHGRRLATDLRRYLSRNRLQTANEVGLEDSSSIAETHHESRSLSRGPPSSMETVVNSTLAPHHVGMLAERAAQHAVGSVQRQYDSDRRFVERRFQQLEQKVENFCEERSREADARKKWAEVQGSVNGLLEELYSLARRIETMEQRLSTRTSGLDQVRQRSQEIEQQVQALEQSAKLSEAAHDEVQKRQSTKIHRSEHMLEELSRRMAKMEEDMQILPRNVMASHSQKDFEQIMQRLVWLEAQEPGMAAQMHQEELRQRIEMLEERHCEAPSKQHCRDITQAQDNICDLAKQVSCLAQRSGISEAAVNNLQEQVHHMQGTFEVDPSSREGGLVRAMTGTRAELGALSQQVADMAARLVEVEGGLASELHHRPVRLSDEHLREAHHQDEHLRRGHHQECDDAPREMAVSERGTTAWPQLDGSEGHHDMGVEGSSPDEILRELHKVRQWLVSLEHGLLAQRGGHMDLEDSFSSEASPQHILRQRQISDLEVEDLHSRSFDDLPQRVSEELQAKEDMSEHRRADLNVLGLRVGKLEDATDLYLSYTKCVASDHADQMEKLGMRLQDIESSHKVVQQVLHEWQLRGDEEGVRSVAEQIADAHRQQAMDCNDGTNGRSPSDHRLDAELAHRLCAIEERLEASCELAMAQADQVMRRVAEELRGMAEHRHDLDEAKASISALSQQVSAIEGRTAAGGPWWPLDNEAIVKRLTPSTAVEKALSIFTADFEAQAQWMEAMDDEDLDNMEAALKRMQGTCLQAATDIAIAVQGELLALQDCETPSSAQRGHLQALPGNGSMDSYSVEPPQRISPPRLEVPLGQRRAAMDSGTSSVEEELDADDDEDDDGGGQRSASSNSGRAFGPLH